MTQTTGQMSAIATKVEISTNASTWTDISGSTNVVDVPEQSLATGSAPTFGSQRHIVSNGAKEPITITVTSIYTEAAGESFETVRAIFETISPDVYLRYSIGGGTNGDFQFTTDAGKLSGFKYPSATMVEGAPVPFTFSVFTPGLTKAVVST